MSNKKPCTSKRKGRTGVTRVRALVRRGRARVRRGRAGGRCTVVMAGRVMMGLFPRLLHHPTHAFTLTRAHARTFNTSHALCLKEIVVEENDGGSTMVVEGQYLPSPNTHRLVKTDKEAAGACPLCALNLDVKHTDVLILSQFMRGDGSVLPRRVTGLCGKQQKRITWLVIMAQKAGLMPTLAPANSKKDPHRRFGSKKYNRYFDESTLPNK